MTIWVETSHSCLGYINLVILLQGFWFRGIIGADKRIYYWITGYWENNVEIMDRGLNITILFMGCPFWLRLILVQVLVLIDFE